VKIFGKMPHVFLYVWCGKVGAMFGTGAPPYILTLITLNVRAVI